MNDDCLRRMVRIPAGEFLMGADDADLDARPVHPVFVDEVYLGAYPVTIGEYACFVRDGGYKPISVRELPTVVSPENRETFCDMAQRYAWRHGLPPEGMDDHPVTLVRHADAVEYCRWLSDSTGRAFRLPTEAEWEKAARGGLVSRRFPWGDEIDPSRANYLPDPSLKTSRGTQPVGCYAPNGYRLYDMAGNVWQWVSDWYDPGYYALSEQRNPPGPSAGRFRCVRGGSWVNDDVALLRCAHRHEVPADTYSYSIGFRVAFSAV